MVSYSNDKTPLICKYQINIKEAIKLYCYSLLQIAERRIGVNATYCSTRYRSKKPRGAESWTYRPQHPMARKQATEQGKM